MPDFDNETVTPPISPTRDLGRVQRFTVYMDPKGNSVDHLELVYDLYSSADPDLESEQVVLRRFTNARSTIQPVAAALKAIIKTWMADGKDEDRPA